jgi:hypothetical protein
VAGTRANDVSFMPKQGTGVHDTHPHEARLLGPPATKKKHLVPPKTQFLRLVLFSLEMMPLAPLYLLPCTQIKAPKAATWRLRRPVAAPTL